ncbi:heavy metal-binding domain-containing protein [Aureivirga marina]|uniref:heavy metal-binding domain-containing protein n=1 Tax=Aureivirga marina TaxID=1182451 RepID=UPI0018CA1AAD|nr:heavy metal-binding domain-containing protein [Aureivirga marina]
MKKTILAVVFIATSLVAVSCGEAPKTENNEATTPKTEAVKKEEAPKKVETKEIASADIYQCPMDCEKGKTYEKEGKCPTCKMDLAKVAKDASETPAKEESHKGHGHDSHEGHAH